MTKKLPVQRLFNLIVDERREVFGIVIYALLNSLLLLAIPLAAQALVNVSAAGLSVQPLLVLSGGLFLGLLFAGVLTCLRFYLAEHMLQRIFCRVAIRVADILPIVKNRHLCRRGGPELMNRFFDVINIQKSWFKIVYDAPGAVLEIILGLSLLALYGTELFLVAGAFVTIGGLIVALAGVGGVKSSIQESACKYRVAEWLEEMVRCQVALRLNLRAGFWNEEADRRIVDYLNFRRRHFGVLMRQVVLHYLVTALGMAGMLGYGGYQVLLGQLSLGQLVAAELVVWSLFKATEKLLRAWDAYFDLLTGLDKVGYITDLPVEKTGPAALTTTGKGVLVQVSELSYAHSKGGDTFLDNINLTLQPGERVAILGESGAGKTTLLKIIGGYLNARSGSVEIDRVDVRELSPEGLAEAIGFLSDRNELFAGSLVDNVAVGRDCDLHKLRELILETGGKRALRQSSQGGYSPITSAGSVLSSGERTSILLSRALLSNPRLLMIDDSLSDLDEVSLREVIELTWLSSERPTILTTSTNPRIVGHCDRVVILDGGTIAEVGTPTELASRADSSFRRLYPTLCQLLLALEPSS